MDVEAMKNTAAVYMEPVKPEKRTAAKPAPTERRTVKAAAAAIVSDDVAGDIGAKASDKPKTPEEKENIQAGAKKLKEAVSEANDILRQTRTGCEFDYNETMNRVTIKVYDKASNKVIREIPPEKSLKALEKVWELAGILVDEKC